MKYKYSIYALEHEWLQCSGIGHYSPAYCMTLVTIIITIKYDKREWFEQQSRQSSLDMNANATSSPVDPARQQAVFFPGQTLHGRHFRWHSWSTPSNFLHSWFSATSSGHIWSSLSFYTVFRACSINRTILQGIFKFPTFYTPHSILYCYPRVACSGVASSFPFNSSASFSFRPLFHCW